MSYNRELQVALEAVLQASRLCREVSADIASAGVTRKKDSSPVTIADFGAQAVINTELLNAFPYDEIIGEEDSSKLQSVRELKTEVIKRIRNIKPGLSEKAVIDALDAGKSAGGKSGRFWAVDPIDGTKGFLRGDQYVIAIGLIVNGRVVLGVLGCPNLPAGLSPESRDSDTVRGVIVYAVYGEGSYMRSYNNDNPIRIHVSGIAKTNNAWFTESVEPAHSSHGKSKEIAEILGITKQPLRIDSQAKYVTVARGDSPIYLRIPKSEEYKECIWDHAAGSIIVEEASGRVTDIYGNKLDFSSGRKLTGNTGIVASNGLLHDAVVDAVKRIL
ncbi:MAG: 3'(2'),5'-bisphosphate nucleotidase [Spirochaetes bacterium]|nr:3'(2'),5'-bisphosphate nucleotidase [Spirochaetota bacterium]